MRERIIEIISVELSNFPMQIIYIICDYRLRRWSDLTEEEKIFRVQENDYSQLDLRGSIVEIIKITSDDPEKKPNFYKSNFSYSDISGENLSNANLSKANLTGTSTIRTDFRDVLFFKTKMDITQVFFASNINFMKYYLDSYCAREDKQGWFCTPTHKRLVKECMNPRLSQQDAKHYMEIFIKFAERPNSFSEFWNLLHAIVQRKVSKPFTEKNKKYCHFLLFNKLQRDLPGLKNVTFEKLNLDDDILFFAQ